MCAHRCAVRVTLPCASLLEWWAAPDLTPHPLRRVGGGHWADSGRAICAKWVGQSALYTGRDLSAATVERVTVEDIRAWPGDLGALRCAS